MTLLSKKYYLYGLSSSGDVENIRYIGITGNIKRRVTCHKCKKSGKGTHKRAWVDKLIRQGNELVITILDESNDAEEIKTKEISCIRLFRSFGAKLVNATSGGDGVNRTGLPYRVTENMRKRYENAKGKPILWLNEYWKDKKRPGNINGRPFGYKVTDETKKKLSESKKGKKRSPEMIERSIAPQRGKPKFGKRKSVIIFDTIENKKIQVLGIIEAARTIICNPRSISNFLKRNIDGEYLFMYRYKITIKN